MKSWSLAGHYIDVSEPGKLMMSASKGNVEYVI